MACKPAGKPMSPAPKPASSKKPNPFAKKGVTDQEKKKNPFTKK